MWLNFLRTVRAFPLRSGRLHLTSLNLHPNGYRNNSEEHYVRRNHGFCLSSPLAHIAQVSSCGMTRSLQGTMKTSSKSHFGIEPSAKLRSSALVCGVP